MFFSLSLLFILKLLFLNLGIGLCEYTFPNLITFQTISRASSTYGTLRKIRTNSEYLIAMSDYQIIIYSTKNLTIVSTLKPSTGVFSSISSNFIDFSFSAINNNLIGILFKSQFNLYYILNKTIIQNTKNSIGSPYYRVFLARYTTTFLLQNHYVYRYNRTNMILKNAFDPGYVSMPTGQICQTINNQYYRFWTPYNRIKIFQCISSSNQATLIYQTPNDGAATNKVNRIVSNPDCQYIYSQSDDYRTPEIFQISSRKIQKLPVFNKIFSHFSFDSLNLYSGMILQNSSLLIYSRNSQQLVKQYQLDFHISSAFIDTDNHNNYIYIGLSQEIKIVKFQCGHLTFMSEVNLCSPCASTCFNCSNVDGTCYSCINQNYTLINNGSCIQYTSNYTSNNNTQNQTNSNNQSSQYQQFIDDTNIKTPNDSYTIFDGIYEFQNYFANQCIQMIFKTSEQMSVVIFFLSASPFGYLFLSFMNFWNITSIYALLNIHTPQYLKVILKMSYDLINTPFFQYIDKDQKTSNFFENQVENQLIEKYPEKINQNFNISSKFISSNFQPILFQHLFIQLFQCYMFVGKISQFQTTFQQKINQVTIYCQFFNNFQQLFYLFA